VLFDTLLSETNNNASEVEAVIGMNNDCSNFIYVIVL